MKKLFIAILIITVVVFPMVAAACGKKTDTTAATTAMVYDVKRGNLSISVSSEGNLTMPDEYNLKFGTNGQVQHIFVEEGDQVKQGALLALLDDTSQRNAIKTALLNVQTAQNNITVQSKTDSLAAGCDHLPYTYPDLSVPRIFKQAQKDLDLAQTYFQQGDYKNAGYYLVMSYFDVEVGEDLISSKPDAAELAGAKTNSTFYPDLYEGGYAKYAPPTTANVVAYMETFRQQLLDISDDLKAGAYDRVSAELTAAQDKMFTVYNLAEGTVYLKGSAMFEYPDTATSVDFLQSAVRGLQDLQTYLAENDAEALEAAKQLYIAQLNLLVGQDVLQNQTSLFVVGKGINWQTLQQYNLALQNAQISLQQAKRAIMNTAIIAPADGTIVAVNLKKSSVLSAQNYSATTAIQLVDTGSVRFEGKIDEIDIMKVRKGQKAAIIVDALTGQELEGTVQFVSPFGVKTGNVVKFDIIITLAPTEAQLRGGLSATADISAYEGKNVLLVPVNLVVNTPEGTVIAVVDPKTGNAVYKPITVGYQNFVYAEVLSGVNEGDKVTRISTTSGTGTSSGSSSTGTQPPPPPGMP
jgi:RND family efflux transporter MFP subunit